MTYQIEIRLTQDGEFRRGSRMVLPEESNGQTVYDFMLDVLDPFQHLVNIEVFSNSDKHGGIENADTPRQRWGTCCPYDPECEHSFLDDDELEQHMDTPIKEDAK